MDDEEDDDNNMATQAPIPKGCHRLDALSMEATDMHKARYQNMAAT